MSTLTARQQFVATVSENVALCREHFRLVLSLDSFPRTTPGQFIQISCRDANFQFEESEFEWSAGTRSETRGRELASPLALLRRPFSLAGRTDNPGRVELEIIHRVVGAGTQWLSGLKSGDALNIIGPLGNRFDLPPADHTAVLVGGGVGIPPMLYLAAALANRSAVAFCGALTKDLLPLTLTCDADASGARPSKCVQEFSRHGIPSIITTDDGSTGFRGFVTQALEKWLDSQRSPRVTIYTCGPEPMMKRVAEIALSHGIPCQIAVERAMACGMGTCQSCCIRVRKDDPAQPPLPGKDWCYRLACTDGPVFTASQLLW